MCSIETRRRSRNDRDSEVTQSWSHTKVMFGWIWFLSYKKKEDLWQSVLREFKGAWEHLWRGQILCVQTPLINNIIYHTQGKQSRKSQQHIPYNHNKKEEQWSQVDTNQNGFRKFIRSWHLLLTGMWPAPPAVSAMLTSSLPRRSLLSTQFDFTLREVTVEPQGLW